MRISDWSSDVCSSDLHAASEAVMVFVPEADDQAMRLEFALPTRTQRAQTARLGATFAAGRRTTLAITVLVASAPHRTGRWRRHRRLIEIGSASCRERVCPYV